MRKILSLDDSITMVQTVKLALTKAGYEVVTFTEGQKALDYLQGNKVGLVVTDLHMPAMDGITFIKKVRSLPNYRFTPIIILTTETQVKKKEEARQAGATAWVTKPFTPAQLVSVVQKVLR